MSIININYTCFLLFIIIFWPYLKSRRNTRPHRRLASGGPSLLGEHLAPRGRLQAPTLDREAPQRVLMGNHL